MRPPFKEMLVPVKRAGEYRRANWKLYFLVFLQFYLFLILLCDESVSRGRMTGTRGRGTGTIGTKGRTIGTKERGTRNPMDSSK